MTMSGLGSDDNTPDMTRGPALLAVSVTMTVVALSTCILRFCVRVRINQKVVWDDYFLGLAMLLGFVGTIFTIVESANNDTVEVARQFDFLSQPWLNMAFTLSKVSVCLFFLRLVSRVRAWRIVLGLQILFLLLVNLAYSLTTLLQCRPMEKLWDSSVEGDCWSVDIQHNFGYFQGAFDIFSDLFIALFPIMIIQDLDINRNIRWPFYALSFFSIVIALLAVVRTYNISLTNSEDQYPYQLICTILAVLEQNLGIVAANILPIASLFSNKIRPISQVLSAAASARNNGDNNSDTVSILSRASKASKASKISKLSARIFEHDDAQSIQGESSDGGIESWPMGIIKTVSVEIVEEDAPNLAQRGNWENAKPRGVTIQEWERR